MIEKITHYYLVKMPSVCWYCWFGIRQYMKHSR